MILYGKHACLAALANPQRYVEVVYFSNSAIQKEFDAVLKARKKKTKIEVLDKQAFQNVIAKQVKDNNPVHQGVCMRVEPLNLESFSILEQPNTNQVRDIVVVLDKVTDPHNIGAIMRSSAVFGVRAMVMLDKSSPKETPALVKTASGAFETVPRIIVKNLSQGIKTLQNMGYWTIGFSEEAPRFLHQEALPDRVALIVGNEGEGIRPLTEKHCDFHVKLPTCSHFSTLNVSNAAAVALYEVFKT